MNPATDMVVYVIPGASGGLSEWAGAIAAIGAVFSAAAALIALYFSIKQIKEHDRHNKLMTRPYLTSNTSVLSIDNVFSYSIENNGLGPAVIKDVRVLVDGKEVPGHIQDKLINTVNLVWPGSAAKIDFALFTAGEYVRAGTKFEILKLSNMTVAVRDFAEAFSHRARILVEYESILGESFTLDSSKDPQFKDYPTS